MLMRAIAYLEQQKTEVPTLQALKEAYYEGRAARRRSLRELAVSVSNYALNPLSEIESIAFANGLQDAEKREQIRAVLLAQAELTSWERSV
jgi:hypothetical protein